ncbi:hypothetical protein SAMN05877753_109147 [Bacillus oleivorans]|uniref:Uncharacterized protein n=1 Tax=Bacillus oleivorans TaxID=1448271 RepID=A0A285D5Q2_9BACI|nr:hypothetical protein [Bacillus oleivorans]SNX74493.1 hypothetical protein SAMN05877753_109147 [Bacillus oleivorans]
MILPKNFDQNEWFVLIFLTVVIVIICFLPKRFPRSITILILVYTATVGRITDRTLAAPWADFYDIMDTGKYDLFDLLTYILYALFGYILIYLFDMLNVKGLWILVYIVLWSLASVGLEWMSSQFEVVKYKEWVPYLSFSYYLAVQALTLLFFKYLKRVYRNTIFYIK